MANQEQLDILKKGVKVWNEWRAENQGVRIDLSEDDLSGANLVDADLRGSDLSGSTLSDATLSGSYLRCANLSDANLRDAHLGGADLIDTILRDAILYSASLLGASLLGANLHGADLRFADLRGAILRNATLSDADLGGAKLLSTVFGNVDLSTVKGLESTFHQGPSTIGIDTIYRSGGNIPEAFLKGAGVDDTFIRSLVGKPIEYYSCFISYSSKDNAFAKRLHADLQRHNVRCWFAPEDLKWGKHIRTGIDEAIHLQDKLLLILSNSSVTSGWVEHEVNTALARERKEKQTILFPVRVDRAVFESPLDWATEIRRERNIGDFTRWKNHDEYEKAFTRLLRDLKSEVMTC